MMFALAALLALAQPDQKEIDAAIKKGADWLLDKYERRFNSTAWNSTLELTLLTLSHAGVAPDHAVFKKGLEQMLSCKLQHTYRVALHAMALQRIDAVKHRARIAECAQWLVDTQCQDGEWGYPGTVHSWDDAPNGVTVAPPKIEEKKDKGGTVSKIVIRRKLPADGRVKGDISNAQFALLGLKACEEAGIEIPKATWNAALGWFLKIQGSDGGWGYFFQGQKDKGRYGSMTCAGICAVAICRYYLGVKDPSKDTSVRAGLTWLTRGWSVSDHPGIKDSNVADPAAWHFYYLYSIERTGKIVGVEKIGKNDWYADGAAFLLKEQKPDGRWFSGVTNPQWKQSGDLEAADTCFGILFLTKATPPLVATGSAK